MDASSLWGLIGAALGALGVFLVNFNKKPPSGPSPSVPAPVPAPTPGTPYSITLTGPIAELLAPLVRVLNDPMFGPALVPIVQGLVAWVRERFMPTKDGSAVPFAGNPWAPPADEPAA